MEIDRFNGIDLPVNFICDNPNAATKKDYINIFIYVEPPCIINLTKFLIDNQTKYDYILTHNPEVLSKCKNARQYYFGSSWINKNDYQNVDINEKEFKISTLVGQKNFSYGHAFRQKLLHRQKDIKFLECYRSKNDGGPNQYSNPVLSSSKFELFKKYQYSIVIENCAYPNWFSEKLIDCLICKTIPIYFGDPCISKIFNTSGWVIVENDDIGMLKNKIDGLTENHYKNHIGAIEENYDKAIYYADFYENVSRTLREINKELK